MTTRTTLSTLGVSFRQTKRFRSSQLEREKTIINAYKKGMSLNDIERSYSCGVRTAKKIILRNGLKLRETVSIKEKVRNLLSDGKRRTANEIAEELKIREDPLRSHILYYGLKRTKCDCGSTWFYTLKKVK